jgi:hypothetical protein
MGVEAGLIPTNEIFALVLDACPSFLTTWELLQHDRNRASDDALHDRAVDALCRHVTRMIRHSKTENLVPTFSVIERLFIESEPDVQEKARSLIHALRREGRDGAGASASADQIRQRLGAHSAERWDDFEKWLHANRLIDEWAKSRSGRFPQVDFEAIKDPQLRSSLQETCDIYKKWLR